MAIRWAGAHRSSCELADHAAADRLRGDLDRRVLVVHQRTLEDPTGVYPNPNSSAPTAFTIFTGSSNIFISLGSSSVPLARHQFTLNTQSSAAAK